MLRSSLLAWGLGLLALGCASGPGRVESGHYTSKRYPLEVSGNGDAASAGLMPTGWKLDNFYGSPLPDTAKTTEEYHVLFDFDRNNDGEVDLRRRVFLYELRFKSLTDDAFIWLRVVPVSTDLRDVQLPVLVESYVQGLSGGNYELVKLGTRGVVADKHYASTLVSARPCKLANNECLLATIEVANVDQLKVSPEARTRKIELLIARANLVFETDHYAAATFVVAGYSNQPARFEAGLHDFHDLLQRVAIRKQAGLELVGAPPSPPEPATGVTNPSAPSPSASNAAAPAPSPPAEPPADAPAPAAPVAP